MRIDFRSSDVLVPQQCLNHSQVGSTLEQSGGKTVSQRMGRNGFLDTRILCRILDHDENHYTGKMGTSAVQKDIIFLSGLDFHEIAVDVPQVDFLQCPVRDRHQPFLPSLSQNSDKLILLKDLTDLEIRQLRNTQYAGEKGCDDSLIALHFPFREIDGSLQHIHLLYR